MFQVSSDNVNPLWELGNVGSSYFKAIQMQITAWYIFPGEDTNKQFFLE